MKQKYEALLAFDHCGDKLTLSPGLHHVTLRLNSRAGANSVWTVLECEGVSGWDTMCAMGLSLPCCTQTHVDSFLWP